MQPSARGPRLTVGCGIALAFAMPIVLAACGDDDDKKSTKAPAKVVATPLAITTTDAGVKRFSTQAPDSIECGIGELTFTNAGKSLHEAQLVRIDDANRQAPARRTPHSGHWPSSRSPPERTERCRRAPPRSLARPTRRPSRSTASRSKGTSRSATTGCVSSTRARSCTTRSCSRSIRASRSPT